MSKYDAIGEHTKQFFRKNILLYYQKNKRDLPWRDISDPYKIWISEIILQQTQVKQALSYYQKIIQKFPDVKSLAKAKEEEILHLWQGLGYYSRARNLHYAAKQILNEYNGIFPSDFNTLLKLKGIGEYTAAAIASFAFNLPYAVLDGNVFRVLSRFFGIETATDTSAGKKYFLALANELLDKKHPSEYNQAIMEFGATYCKPQSPDCFNCLLNKHCQAYLQNKVNALPIKSKTLIKKERYFNYIIFIENKKYTYICKRQKNDIWKSLYEFYLIESKKNLLSENKIKQHLNKHAINFKDINIIHQNKHILTHQNLHIQFIIVKIPDKISSLHLKRIPLKNLPNYPFPIVIKNLLNEIIEH